MRKAMYLKINRTENFALKNLARWINVGNLMNLNVYIICDKPDLTDKIRQSLCADDTVFLTSRKDDFLRKIVVEIADDYWYNAAYAHLTTFVHAKENGYEYFWNIDADDTFICLPIDRIAELMRCAEEYAENNDINLFSLDMWRTRTLGKHWSFGITYTNGKIDWVNAMLENYINYSNNIKQTVKENNIDWFFTYLKEKLDLNIETFYFENLKFIHYSNDFFCDPTVSGLFHWKSNTLNLPIISSCLGIEKYGKYNIYKDIIKLDINISDEEIENTLISYTTTPLFFSVPSEKIAELKERNMQIVAWGAGYMFPQICRVLKDICDLLYVVDTDSQKWGKYFDGIKCISPDELKSMKNMAVIITTIIQKNVKVIHRQLIEMGIEEIMNTLRTYP